MTESEVQKSARHPRADALAPFVVALLVAVGVSVLWLRFNATPPELGKQIAGDLVNYFYPLNRLAAERLANGELPLWNSDACSGIPLLATLQVAVFYPGTWLSLLLPSEVAMPRVLLLECLLGGWFCGLLFLRWGVGAVAAAAGGVLFVFSCLVGQTFWPPQVHTIVWMPWVLLCVESLATRSRWRWRWWVALALGTALQLVAGFPQFAAYTFYLAAPYALVRLSDRNATARGCPSNVEGSPANWEGSPAKWDGSPAKWDGSPSRALRAFGMASAVAVGVVLAAIQLLPTLELTGLGARSGPLGPAQVHYLLGLDAPITPFFANLIDPAPRLLSFDFRQGSGYLGTATLLLAAIGAFCGRPRRAIWLFLAVGAVSVLLSFGYRGPSRALYELYAQLPTVGLFRTPERFRLLIFFCVIAVAVTGLGQVVRGFDGTSPARSAAALGFAGVVAIAIAALGAPGIAWRSLVAAALIGVAFALRAKLFVATLCGVALLALTLVDLGRATAGFGSLRAFPSAWSETFHDRGVAVVDGAALAALRLQADGGRIALNRLWPMTPAPPIHRASRVSCYEPLAPSPWPEFHERMGGDPVWGQLLFDTEGDRFEAFHDVAGVRISVTPSDLGRLGGFMLGSRWHEKRAPPIPTPLENVKAVSRVNDDALPRAYQTERFEVRDLDAALEHVAKGDFDFHAAVLLGREPGMSSGAPGIRPARITSHAHERVTIAVEGERESLLVLSDTWLPGWTARVDGVEGEIFRANAFYRAVRVPAGAREVVFEYAPASLRRGAWLSLAGALGLVMIPVFAWGVWPRLSRAHRPAPNT